MNRSPALWSQNCLEPKGVIYKCQANGDDNITVKLNHSQIASELHNHFKPRPAAPKACPARRAALEEEAAEASVCGLIAGGVHESVTVMTTTIMTVNISRRASKGTGLIDMKT